MSLPLSALDPTLPFLRGSTVPHQFICISAQSKGTEEGKGKAVKRESDDSLNGNHSAKRPDTLDNEVT